jgi:hypothetical protein
MCPSGATCLPMHSRDSRGRDRMVVGFTTTYAMSAYHHLNCEFELCSWRCVLDKTLTMLYDIL